MSGKLRHEDFNNMLPLIAAAVASQGKWVLGVNLTAVLALLSGSHPANDGTGQWLPHQDPLDRRICGKEDDAAA